MSQHREFRIRVRFSADGRHCACLAVADHTGDGAPGADRSQVHLEGWVLAGGGPRRWLRVSLPGAATGAYALPVPGRRLLLRQWRDGQPYLSLIGTAGTVASRPVPELRITTTTPDGGLAVGLADRPDGGTEVFRIEDRTGHGGGLGLSELARAPATLCGPGVVVADRMVFYTRSNGVPVPQVFDPAAGGLAPAAPAVLSGALPVHGAGDTLLLAVPGDRRPSLATTSLRSPDRLDPLDGVAELAGAVQPLALDPAAREVALRLRHGITSRLLRYRLATGQLHEIDAPPGSTAPPPSWADGALPAAWGPDGLWLAYTTTTAPTGLWWLRPGASQLRPAPGGVAPPGQPGRVETLPGPAGPIEAVTYGDWRTSAHVVVALHGGPADHWPLAFDPGLQAFASSGFAVVAPNQRGSTGYGRAHHEAIKGAWGGPDLADVVAVGAHLERVRGPGRSRPGLYGFSYGAFLGLLALAEAPRLWSGCVAVAPFLSAARLHADAGAAVRSLVDRLDGTATVTDGIGPRDLLGLAPRMRGRVLVLHGDRDPNIPVTHSRALVAALAGAPDVAVTYRELPGGGHFALRPDPEVGQFAEVLRFLGRDRDAGGDSDVGAPVSATPRPSLRGGE